MQNLKIRVSSPEETNQAQTAFFALGGKWAYGQIIQHLYKPFLYLREDKIMYGEDLDGFYEEVGEEVTLGELLALAAEAKNTGLNSFEIMVEEKMSNLQSCIEKAKTNGWQKDGRDADEQVAELRGYEGDASWGEFEPSELERAKLEAQARYDAAEKYFEENKGYEWCDYVEAHNVSLKIAAGLDPKD